MTKLKQLIIDLRIILKLYNSKQMLQKQRILCGIQNFYEDMEYPLYNLGIAKIQFKFNKDICNLYITLSRPGLLIGKAGSNIDALTKYLNNDNYKTKIYIIESDLFKTSYKHIINL